MKNDRRRNNGLWTREHGIYRTVTAVRVVHKTCGRKVALDARLRPPSTVTSSNDIVFRRPHRTTHSYGAMLSSPVGLPVSSMMLRLPARNTFGQITASRPIQLQLQYGELSLLRHRSRQRPHRRQINGIKRSSNRVPS